MIKDEVRFSLMCEISMALKSPKLQQGFEIICKNLSELEEENAELNDKLKNLASVAEYETQELLDKQIEATYKVAEKLNKAEEILREFVEWANWQGNSKCPSFKSIQDKAEQFLSEVQE